MKRIITCGLRALAVILAFGLPVDSSALPPTSRRMAGTLENADTARHTLVVSRSDSCEPVQLNWNERTRFVENARFTSAGLRVGKSVVVTYRTPFFVESIATKVVIESGGAHMKAKYPLHD